MRDKGGNSGQNAAGEGMSIPPARELIKSGTLAHATIVRK